MSILGWVPSIENQNRSKLFLIKISNFAGVGFSKKVYQKIHRRSVKEGPTREQASCKCQVLRL